MDHRANSRHAVDVEAKMQIGQTTVGCRLANLSVGGAFVLGPTLPIDSQVTLYLTLPVLGSVLEAPSSVRWSSELGCGLQFDGLRPLDVWALGKYIGGTTARELKPRRGLAPS